MIVKIQVDKVGELENYLNLPVTNKIISKTESDSFIDKHNIAIGVITEAIELEDKYELTIHIWDRFTSVMIEQYDTLQPASISIEF